MKKVIYGKRTLYDAWYDLNQFRPEDNGFTNLGSGSDYTAFLQLGIGALDFSMDAARNTPVYHYHSNYDSHHWMKTFIDPDFSIHTSAGQYMTLLAYHLADDALLPFDMDAYARNINYWVRDLVGMTLGIDKDYGEIQRQLNISELDAAAKKFQRIALDFSDLTLSKPFLDDAERVTRANGLLRDLQRLFVRREGLPGRPFYKNALYAPNRNDGYRAQTLPASVEALEDRNFPLCREWNLWLTDAIHRASEKLLSA